jgi:hypothetical protein
LSLEVQTIPLALGILVGLARIQVEDQSFEPALLLASYAEQNPASTQETKDAAGIVTSVAVAHLSTVVIQAVQKRAAQLSLESLAEQIFNRHLDNSLTGSNIVV